MEGFFVSDIANSPYFVKSCSFFYHGLPVRRHIMTPVASPCIIFFNKRLKEAAFYDSMQTHFDFLPWTLFLLMVTVYRPNLIFLFT